MSRRRMVWRDCLTDLDLGRCSDPERLLWVGLIILADDDGRGIADPDFLRSSVWPYHVRSRKWTEGTLKSLAEKMQNLHLYEANGHRFYALLKWSEYQIIRKDLYRPSNTPPPPLLGRHRNETEPIRNRYNDTAQDRSVESSRQDSAAESREDGGEG